MKNIGIIRKIDELGRIVIPKEIRNILKIKSNDYLEMIIIDEMIQIKKYSVMENNKETANSIINNSLDFFDGSLFVSDKEKIITKGLLENIQLNDKLLNIMDSRKQYISKSLETLNLKSKELNGYFIIYPLIIESDVIGLIIMQKNKKIDDNDINLITLLKKIIENS